MEATTSFHYAMVRGILRPTFDWTIDFEYYTDQSATVIMTELTEQRVSVTVWIATTKNDNYATRFSAHQLW
jgi:hypothetical protein